MTVYSEHMTQMLALYAHPERFAALEARWGFRLCVVLREGNGAALTRWLLTQARWQLRYQDARVLIFTRTS
jgi:hypothetical protein